MQIQVRFETQGGRYVPVLSNSALATGHLVSQNAGSTNSTIYYQVGGGGLNGYFEDALGQRQTERANRALVAAYDAKFGGGAWKRDQGSDHPPLTSFFIPLTAAECAEAGDRFIGMIYSVGPKLTSAGITDEKQYRDIYIDAFTAAVDANAADRGITAVRIAMLSTGLYAGSGDPTTLFNTSARLILDGIEQAASAAAEAHFPQTVLVNNGADNNEAGAFTHAAQQRGLPVDQAGFDLTVNPMR